MNAKFFNTKLTAPVAIGRFSKRRIQTIHVVASVAIIAKQQFIIILRIATDSAAFALDAKPIVALGRQQHIGREIQTRWMKHFVAFKAGDKLFILTDA